MKKTLTPIEKQMKANGYHMLKKIGGGWMCMHRDLYGNDTVAYDDPANDDMNGDEETALAASYAQLLEGQQLYMVKYCTRIEEFVVSDPSRGELEGLLLDEAKAYVDYKTCDADECDAADNTNHNDRWHLEVYPVDYDIDNDDPLVCTPEYYM